MPSLELAIVFKEVRELILGKTLTHGWLLSNVLPRSRSGTARPGLGLAVAPFRPSLALFLSLFTTPCRPKSLCYEAFVVLMIAFRIRVLFMRPDHSFL